MTDSTDLAGRRKEYETAGLDASDLAPSPMDQWRGWFDQAASFYLQAGMHSTANSFTHARSRFGTKNLFEGPVLGLTPSFGHVAIAFKRVKNTAHLIVADDFGGFQLGQQLEAMPDL